MTNRVGCKKVLIINLISYKRPIKCHTNHNVPLALKISREYGFEITMGLLQRPRRPWRRGPGVFEAPDRGQTCVMLEKLFKNSLYLMVSDKNYTKSCNLL